MQATPGIKHLIGQGKGIGECGLLVGHPEQVLVWDDEQGVHDAHQFRDAGFGKTHAALALEVEWLGDYTDGENAKLTRGLGDNGRCPGTGTAAHTGSNEHHVCAGQIITDLIDCFFRCSASHFGLRASTKASGHLGTHLDDTLGHRHGECLCVGIGDDEVDALQPSRDHVVDGVAAGAADPKYDTARLHLANIGDVGHSLPPMLRQE